MEAPAGVAAATAAAAAAAAAAASGAGAGAASSNSSANASSGGGGGGGGPPPDESWFPGPRSPYTPAEAVLIALVLLCVIVGTVVGNVLVCVAVCLVRKLRRPCNYLLVSLAVSDLCVALLVMPMALLSEIFGVWSFGPVACDLWVSFDVLSCTASILNLCMISVDRYYAITKPLEYGVRRTPRRMVASVALVWLGAACISLPPLLILGNEHEDPHGLPQCQVCQNFAYQIYATLGSFYIPLSVMIVVYYKIFRAARKIVLEERRAQSHLRAHSYLEISVGNGGGPPETRLAASTTTAEADPAAAAAAAAAVDGAANGNGATPAADEQSSSPAVRAQHQQQHRPSTTSTNTTCSGQTGSSTRCFATSSLPRRSNESQCPMLTPRSRSKKKAASSSPGARAGGGGGGVVGLGAFRSRRRKPPPALALPVTPTGGGAATASATLPPPSAGFSSQSSPPPRQTQQRRLRFALAKERKASTTLGIIMSAFTFCWLPFFVLALVRPFTDIPPSLSSLFLWLGYANSLFNPIIYATLNRDFRKPFQQILYFRCSSLNHMMREEFYHSQYGDPDHHQYYVINTAAAATGAGCSGGGGGGLGGGGTGGRPLSAASGAAPSLDYREDDERLSAAGDGPTQSAAGLVVDDDDDDDDDDEERDATTALADESFL